ncbi:MAG: hypothetical protein ACOYMN_17380 [Roseimicrobium sp.]
MKKTIIILLILLGAFWASINQHKLPALLQGKRGQSELAMDVEVGEEPEPSATVEVPPASPALPAASLSGSPIATSSPKTLPEGIYYTMERITHYTEAGVVVIGGGVKVAKVGEENGMYLVDDGKNRVLTAPAKLTNDPLEVAKLVQSTIVGQDKKTSAVSRLDSVKKTTSDSSKNKSLKRIEIQDVDRRIYLLRAEVYRLTNEASAARARGRPSTYNDREIVSIKASIAALEAQRTKLQYELASMPK